MLTLRSVSKWHGGRRVIEALSLDVARGDRVVLVGENGCGKSTVIAIAAGVDEAFDGERSAPRAIGYAPERPDLPDALTVAEWFALLASLKGVGDAIDPDVADLAHRRLGALSLGQRQRVSLATAFQGAPELLVLDEPTNALDVDAREALIGRLAGATALIATHDRDFAARIGTRAVPMARRSSRA